MQLEEIVPDLFYRVTDVFDKSTLTLLQAQYWNKHTWRELYQENGILRHESHCDLELSSLLEIQKWIENKLSIQVYPNSTQLWYDYPDYINHMHVDGSPNLYVNCQIYLIDSENKDQGTHFRVSEPLLFNGKPREDGLMEHTWYSVPYEVNTGYIMFKPTEYTHGTKYPVTDQRMSLYQSYRITKEPSPIW